MIVTAAFMGLILAGQSAPAPSQTLPPPALVSEGPSVGIDSKCPVTGKAVTPDKGVKVEVRGREYLVYDQMAAEELKANPDKYLDPDGTPKNARKPGGQPHA